MNFVALHLADDESYAGGGHVQLHFAGLAQHAGDAVSITVKRADPGAPCLGSNGWQPGEHQFKPLALSANDNDLVIVIGPEVVDQIDEYSVVEIAIPELQVAGQVSWAGITYTYNPGAAQASNEPVRVNFSVKASGSIILQAEKNNADIPQQLPPEQPVYGIAYQKIRTMRSGTLALDTLRGTAQLLEQGSGWPQTVAFSSDEQGNIHFSADAYQESISNGVVAFGISYAELHRAASGNIDIDAQTGLGRISAIASARPAVTDKNISAPDNSDANTGTQVASPQAAAQKTNGNKKVLWLLLIIIILVIVAAVAWYLYSQPAGDDPAPDPDPGSGANTPEQTPATPPTAQDGPMTPAQAHAKGVAAYEAGDIDSARKLLRKAANAGYGPTLLFLGQIIDSVDFKPGYLTAPNDISAIKYYAQACNAGTLQAAEALRKLGEALQQRVAQGNEEAELAVSMQKEALGYCQ